MHQPITSSFHFAHSVCRLQCHCSVGSLKIKMISKLQHFISAEGSFSLWVKVHKSLISYFIMLVSYSMQLGSKGFPTSNFVYWQQPEIRHRSFEWFSWFRRTSFTPICQIESGMGMTRLDEGAWERTSSALMAMKGWWWWCGSAQKDHLSQSGGVVWWCQLDQCAVAPLFDWLQMILKVIYWWRAGGKKTIPANQRPSAFIASALTSDDHCWVQECSVPAM